MLIQGFRKFYESPRNHFSTKRGVCLARKKEKVQNPLDEPRFENFYLHPHFTKYTPLCFSADFFLKPPKTLRVPRRWVFFSQKVVKIYKLRNNACFSFRNVAKLYELRNNACFDFQNAAKLYGLCNNACFDLRNIVKLYGLCNNACFEGPKGNKQGSKADRKCPRMKLGYDTHPKHDSLLIS